MKLRPAGVSRYSLKLHIIMVVESGVLYAVQNGQPIQLFVSISKEQGPRFDALRHANSLIAWLKFIDAESTGAMIDVFKGYETWSCASDTRLIGNQDLLNIVAVQQKEAKCVGEFKKDFVMPPRQMLYYLITFHVTSNDVITQLLDRGF